MVVGTDATASEQVDNRKKMSFSSKYAELKKEGQRKLSLKDKCDLSNKGQCKTLPKNTTNNHPSRSEGNDLISRDVTENSSKINDTSTKMQHSQHCRHSGCSQTSVVAAEAVASKSLENDDDDSDSGASTPNIEPMPKVKFRWPIARTGHNRGKSDSRDSSGYGGDRCSTPELDFSRPPIHSVHVVKQATKQQKKPPLPRSELRFSRDFLSKESRGSFGGSCAMLPPPAPSSRCSTPGIDPHREYSKPPSLVSLPNDLKLKKKKSWFSSLPRLLKGKSSKSDSNKCLPTMSAIGLYDCNPTIPYFS